MKLCSVLMLAVAGALTPLAAQGADQPWQLGQAQTDKVNAQNLSAPGLSLDPAKAVAAQKALEGSGPSTLSSPVLTLDAGGTASRIHGFGDFKINTQYITPRGLVAVESSPQFQSVVGLVFDLYHGDGFIKGVSVNGGIWGDFNPHPDQSVVTGADVVSEVDVFAGFGIKFDKFSFDYTIQAWTFPDLTSGHTEIDPTTEYNMDFKFSFDDSSILKDFALHPYIDVFWNFDGDSSPVVSQATAQGKNDHTFYVELGIAPSYTLKAIDNLPITFTLPAYFTMGDSSFWGETPAGDRSNFGVASVGLKISAPLTFIPKDFGNWSAYVGVTYIHTCNPALTYINSGTGADSNLVLGYAGFGFGF